MKTIYILEMMRDGCRGGSRTVEKMWMNVDQSIGRSLKEDDIGVGRELHNGTYLTGEPTETMALVDMMRLLIDHIINATEIAQTKSPIARDEGSSCFEVAIGIGGDLDDRYLVMVDMFHRD